MLAIIGGSGLYQLPGLAVTRRQVVRTPYGDPSSAITFGKINGGKEVAFLARHGFGHTLAPHRINYRANMWALKEIGCTAVLSVATVGAISPEFGSGQLVVPDQIIDYTYGRAHTFFDGKDQSVVHVDMTWPYDAACRAALLEAAQALGVEARDGATYACTQGPRLETAAEIRRYGQDGCQVVGMTAMPEASLARELGLAYAALCVVVNDAAGVGVSTDVVSLESGQEKVDRAMEHVHDVIGKLSEAQM